MSQWKYTGTEGRTFPDHGLEVEPGDVIEADENPDPAFFEAAASKSKSATKS